MRKQTIFGMIALAIILAIAISCGPATPSTESNDSTTYQLSDSVQLSVDTLSVDSIK